MCSGSPGPDGVSRDGPDDTVVSTGPRGALRCWVTGQFRVRPGEHAGAKAIDGPVKAVDPAAKTVTIGWLLGMFGTKLQVNDETQIAVEGSKASLMDIRKGDEVRASYETKNGKNIATSINVNPAEPAKGSATSSGGQGAPYPQSSGTPGSQAPQAQ